MISNTRAPTTAPVQSTLGQGQDQGLGEPCLVWGFHLQLVVLATVVCC